MASGSVNFRGDWACKVPARYNVTIAIAGPSLDGPRLRSPLFSTITNTIGTTRRTKNIENTNPEASTLASGLHRLECERIMGVTPTAAAIVVRKMIRQKNLWVSSG